MATLWREAYESSFRVQLLRVGHLSCYNSTHSIRLPSRKMSWGQWGYHPCTDLSVPSDTCSVLSICSIFLPREHAQGVKRYSLSVVCLSSANKFSNILQADTSLTYNRVISFANSPIVTLVYLTIQNTLQFSVLSGLSCDPVQLVVHLEILHIVSLAM